MDDNDVFFKVTEANKGKRLSSLYFHSCYLYYFHIITSDPYDGTQGQAQG